MTCFPQLTSQPTNLASSSNVFHEVCDPCSCNGKFISSTIIQILLITKHDIWQQVNVLEKPRDHRVVDHELDCSWYKTYTVYCWHETMWRLCITGFHRNKPYNTLIVTFFHPSMKFMKTLTSLNKNISSTSLSYKQAIILSLPAAMTKGLWITLAIQNIFIIMNTCFKRYIL